MSTLSPLDFASFASMNLGDVGNIPVVKPLTQVIMPRHLMDHLSSDPTISITGRKTVFDSDAYGSVRTMMWNRVSDLDPNLIQALIITMENPTSKAGRWAKAAGRNPLHLSAALGNVVVSYEQLFMGASPTYRDKTGFTALYYALLAAARCKFPAAILRVSADNLKPLHDMLVEYGSPEKLPGNLSKICCMLIEQHADVNEVHYSKSLLHIACIAQDWNVITLLLQHGARNTIGKNNYSSLPSWDANTLAKFEKIVAEHALAKGDPRPPRICPCWSGKLLKDCHQKPEAVIIMPGRLPCVCGKHERKYVNCCKKHKITVLEKWSVAENGIRRYTSNWEDSVGNSMYSKLLRIAGYKLKHYFDDDPLPAVITGDEPPDYVPWPTKKTRLLAERLRNEGKIDPAFAHLMLQMRPPLPTSRGNNIRTQTEGAVEGWNRELERYIRLGTDPRPAEEIRRAVKLGAWAGAFYATCQNPGCGKVNAVDGVELKKCSGCSIAQYCSPKCQSAHWKVHKPVCTDGDMYKTPEWLPSQKAFDAVLAMIMAAIPEYRQALEIDESGSQ